MIEKYFIVIVSIMCLVIAQLLKPFFHFLFKKKFEGLLILDAGGFPSSHTASVVGLAFSIGLIEGFDSTFFAIAGIFGGIVMYDAMNVRYYAGKNIELTKQIIHDLFSKQNIKLDNPIYLENIKEILGHERIEVFGGFLLAIVITLLMYYNVY